MTTPLPASLWHSLSREVALVCDASGTITWADERAVRLLETGPGQTLRELAAQGTEDKVDRLLTLARDERVEGGEVILRVGGQPRSFAFRGTPHEGNVALVGSLVPEDHAASLSQVSELRSELSRLNRELEESNRGVRTLHAELDEKTESLVRTAELKGRVVANVSHEFRTPLHSILGLARLLLNPANGPLSSEQHKQVQFIRTSAEVLFELVNDLLDLSKLESGKATLRPTRFGAGDFLGALRGMMRPLVAADSAVELRFEEPAADLVLETDEAKVSQVLRNLVSNALKFTEKGHVTVSAGQGPRDTVCLQVSDTGIGIAPEHHERIFEEFVQVESPLQRKHKGTGLGLALSRRLAELLGGHLTVRSAPGWGTTFTFTLPRVHPEVVERVGRPERGQRLEPGRGPVLVLEDDRRTRFLYEKYLSRSGFQVLPVRTVDEARRTLQRVRPAAVVLDVMLEGETSWSFLSELQSNEATRDIPLLVALSREVAITRMRDALHKTGLSTDKGEGRRG